MARVLVIVLVVVLAAGGVLGWRWHNQEINKTEMVNTITKHIETAGIVTNALQALDAGETDKAREQLRATLEHALRRADEVREHVPPYDPQRKYADMLREARDYAKTTQLGNESVERAERLIGSLP